MGGVDWELQPPPSIPPSIDLALCCHGNGSSTGRDPLCSLLPAWGPWPRPYPGPSLPSAQLPAPFQSPPHLLLTLVLGCDPATLPALSCSSTLPSVSAPAARCPPAARPAPGTPCPRAGKVHAAGLAQGVVDTVAHAGSVVKYFVPRRLVQALETQG